MGVEDGLYKLDHQLRLINGVVDVAADVATPHELRLTVALGDYDWDVRELVVELVDDFARQHVEEVTVLLEVVDAAEAPLSLSA